MNITDLLYEYDSMQNNGTDIVTLLDNINTMNIGLSEAEYGKVTEHLRLEITDVDKFVKVNDCKPITNPVFYSASGIPTNDGLLSNTIFGISQDDRAGIFAYIDLKGTYMDPSCYKCWTRIDPTVKAIIHKSGKYVIDSNGYFKEDPNGSTGIEFLKKNIDKIRFKSTDSVKRDMRIKFLEKNRDKMFLTKYLVIPPYYRDTNTGSGRAVGIGGINKLYQQLIISVNTAQGPQEYGFDMSGAMQGRVQETILAIYDWFSGTTNANMTVDEGVGLSGKLGLLRRAGMSKTSTYSARLIITAPELKAYSPKDTMVNFDKSAVPLAACIALFRPFVQFHVKRFFENEFIGTEQYPVMDASGKITYETPLDPLMEFSDEKIKIEMERFIHGYNNRFVPIVVPIEGSNRKVYMKFKGAYKQIGEEREAIYNRRLTWCDVFYMATYEAVKNKMVLITRYPIDSRFNEITTQIEISSTKKTEPMQVEGNFYRWYPLIREKDIGTNTGHMFIDTMQMSNLYLAGMGGDYDGDTVTAKGVYLNESNDELLNFQKSKANFIDLSGKNIRVSAADAIQSIYSLTRILESDRTKITDPVF